MADQIAVVTASPTVLDPRTGEPRRPWQARVASGLLYLGAALAMAGLLWAMWTSIGRFAEAAWLHRVVPTELGDLLRVALVAGTTATALVVTSAAAIPAYYAWWGYAWTRWAGLVAAALSPLTLMMNPLAMGAIVPIVLGAGLLWLPPLRRFFAEWLAVRHPELLPPAISGDVYYGPLPRYR